MAYVGNLRQYPLSEVLRLIGDGMRRGRIVVEHGGLRADIYCDTGYLMHVWRNGPTTPLAQRWLNSRFITPAQLNHIGNIVGMDPNQLTDADLAQIAVERGVISTDLLAEWAMSDAVDLLTVVLSWPDGDYRFEDGITPVANRLRVPLLIPTVLGATMQRFAPASHPLQPPPPPIEVDLDDVLDFADLDPNDPQPVRLTRDQWRVLTLVDGESALALIAQNLVMASQSVPVSDQQRYLLELRRNEEIAVRVAKELVAEGIAVIFGQPRTEQTGRRWVPST
jgi:hypothetical protein